MVKIRVLVMVRVMAKIKVRIMMRVRAVFRVYKVVFSNARPRLVEPKLWRNHFYMTPYYRYHLLISSVIYQLHISLINIQILYDLEELPLWQLF